MDTMNGLNNGVVIPEPEVLEKKRNRYRSGPEKLRILQEIDTAPSEKGAIIRREGIYSSYVTRWQKDRENGTLLGLSGQKRGRKKHPAHEEKMRIAQLERQNARLEKDLKKCHIIIDVQKKVSEILGITLDPVPDEDAT